MNRTRLLSVLILAACSSKPADKPVETKPVDTKPAETKPAVDAAPAAPAPSAEMTLASAGIVPEWMNKTADPCTDFFEYSCGKFLADSVIPADRSSWSAIMVVVQDAENVLHEVLDKAPAGTKLGDYYKSCTDEAAIEAAGIKPIEPLLAIAASAKDPKSTTDAIGKLHAEGISVFFDLEPQQDFVDATKVIAGLDQSGLGLPDRSFYLENKGTMPHTREVYAKHVEHMLVLGGTPAADAAAMAKEAIRVETEIAKLAQDKVTRRDPHAVYNRVERDGLEKLAPSFPWGDYLKAQGIGDVTAISINSKPYFAGIAKLVASEKPAAIQAYLTWQVLRASAPALTKAFLEEKLVMDGELRGIKQLPPRWRTCVNHVDEDLGELLAQSYVAQRFAGTSKERAAELTKQIFEAMRATIDTLAWMDKDTRVAAKAKLDKMASLVGYPDKWKSYDFDVKPNDFFGNASRATKHELARRLGKIGKPVDRFDWGMTPPTVNAYYDPSLNEIVLPAGQMQPPFFKDTFHPAVNFGATGGSTIGHELTHGFDDEGSQFDGDGNLRDWWSKATKAKFADATKCVADQYSNYEAVPKVKLDGKLTAGENIADNGGVKLGYQAYRAWRAAQATKPPATVEGLSDDQLYFLSYGQSWCDKRTDKALETAASSDPHSPPRWRVNGVIVNQPGFGEAFHCKAGTPMNPGKACSVW
ncbi:MAG TPA: M13 family metallopeptidase [Kofleriaceae bacterium]|nr:M13 family metallopeptidase [Kofleriaceae bacterium]